MRRVIIWSVIVAGVLVVVSWGASLSGRSDMEARAMPTAAYPIPTSARVVVRKGPAPMWLWGDDVVISTDAYSLAVYGNYLTGEETTFVYSLAGCRAQELVDGKRVQIVNQEGRASDLWEVWPLANVEGLEVGVMRFGRRPSGSEELYLTVAGRGEDEEIERIMVLKYMGFGHVDNVDRRRLMGRGQGELEQAGHRIASVRGSGMMLPRPATTRKPEGAPERGEKGVTGKATRVRMEPVRVEPLIEVAEGVSVGQFPALKIEKIGEKEGHLLEIQFFSNGDVVGRLDKAVQRPTPIMVMPRATAVSRPPYP